MSFSAPPTRRLGLTAVLGAALLLSSCPRAGIMTYGVDVSEGEGGALIYKNVKAPGLSLESGTYDSMQTLTLSTETPDATIFYTFSNDPAIAPEIPTMSSTSYTAPIILNGYTAIKAAAFINVVVYSFSVSGEFSFKLSNPTISYDSDTQLVTLASSNAGASIRYLINKTNPLTDSAGTQYSAPFTVSSTEKIRARAFTSQSGWQDSDEISLIIP